jgi:hypothetical protein
LKNLSRFKGFVLFGALAAATLAGGPGSHEASAATVTNYAARGFDSCTRPSLAQMNTWWASSPYYYYAAYVGGPNYSSRCTTPSGPWLSSAVSGTYGAWGLIFTWVGAQMPDVCTTRAFNTYISTNSTTAYSQGNTEGVNAFHQLQALGIPTTNAPLAYDLEGYPAGSPVTTTCRNATKSFMKGWADYLAAPPAEKSGTYGSSCGSYLSDFASDGNPPDFIWGADWDSDPLTSSISCVGSTQWSGFQRFKQYRGGHSETWGNVTLSIDNDCSYGPVYSNTTVDDGVCR